MNSAALIEVDFPVSASPLHTTTGHPKKAYMDACAAERQFGNATLSSSPVWNAKRTKKAYTSRYCTRINETSRPVHKTSPNDGILRVISTGCQTHVRRLHRCRNITTKWRNTPPRLHKTSCVPGKTSRYA